MASATDIAWLAGIIDGEGCFSVKRQIRRKTGTRAGRFTSYQVWLVICNTSEPMMRRIEELLDEMQVQRPKMRRVWKGSRATRHQYWIHVARKRDLLGLIEQVYPYLVAKRDEASVCMWFLRRACSEEQHRQSPLEIAMLDSLGEVKANGGEAPAHIRKMWSEVIPSQAVEGAEKSAGSMEGVEARQTSPNSNSAHECPAALN